MKRIFLIRRRRYLYWAVALGVAVSAFLPTTALARYDERGSGAAVDFYATSSVSAEDDHGLSAATGYVLPAADRLAVEAASTATVVRRADDFTPPRNVTVPSVAAGPAVEWREVVLFTALGLIGIAGLFLLATVASRRGSRVAHS